MVDASRSASSLIGRLGSAGMDAARRLRPGAAVRPPCERSVLEDLSARRPWNIVVKAARTRALVRLKARGLADGVTVVIVSWNTREIVADVLAAVQRLSPRGTRVLVVDNGSEDGSREMLKRWPGIDTLMLPSNAGHGVALDLGLCSVRTTVGVTLDSDALPLVAGWLDPVVQPITEGRAVLAGLRATRGFVHPVYLAIDTRQYLERRLSFQAHVLPDSKGSAVRWGENAWDTAELLSRRVREDELSFVEPTPNAVDGLPGMTAGHLVYHHGGTSREAGGAITADALEGWRAACRALRATSERAPS